AQSVPLAADCIVESAAEAQQAIALIIGEDEVRDVQLLTDRQGWLRALNGRGGSAWSDDDLLCRAPQEGRAGSKQATATPEAGEVAVALAAPNPGSARGDALDRILRAMEAEPVLFVKGGRVH